MILLKSVSLIFLVLCIAFPHFAVRNVLAQQASLKWLGGTSNYEWSEAYDVSLDGSVVTGIILKPGGTFVHPFRWEELSGIQDIESDTTIMGFAYGISGDGSKIVGAYNEGTAWKPFYFTLSSGKITLPTLDGGKRGIAYAADSSGSLIVGQSDSSYFNVSVHAVLWDNDSIVDLGRKYPYGLSCATGISAIDTVIVGYSLENPFSNYMAFCNNTDLETLGGLASYARNVSWDGSTVVGWSTDSLGRVRAFRWSIAGGMSSIHTLGSSYSSDAYDVSRDGSVIVGQACDPGGVEFAFIWTADRGMQNLNIVYASLLTQGSKLKSARAITPDGKIIVGYGINGATGRREAFLLNTGESTDVITEKYSPKEFQLYQNYPNPFNPSTNIQYAIGSTQLVTLKVYDVLGNEISTLVNEEKPAGNYEVEFKLLPNTQGTASCIYFCRMQTKNFSKTIKMLYLK